MIYAGDVAAGATVSIRWNTVDPTGAPVTLAGTPAARVRKGTGGGSTSTSGVSLTVDVVTGQHAVDVDTSADGAFYAAGNDFWVELSAGTVNGISVAGAIVGRFSIVNRADSAGVTTLLGRITSTRAGYLDNLSAGAVALEASVQALNDLDAAGVRSAVGLASANLDTQLAAIDGDVQASAQPGDAMTLTGVYDAAKTAAQAGDAMTLTSGERTTLTATIWAALTSALTTVGSIGKLLVDRIDATISSRLASSAYTPPPTVAAVADEVETRTLEANVKQINDTALTGDGSSSSPWGPA